MMRTRFYCLLIFSIVNFKLTTCFNVEPKVETSRLITPLLINQDRGTNGLVPMLPSAAQPSYFGADMKIQKFSSKTNFSIAIGSPKLINASNPLENIQSPGINGSTGGIYSCKIGQNVFQTASTKLSKSACTLMIPNSDIVATRGDNFGISVPSPPFNSSSYKVCTSTRGVGCGSAKYLSGICYDTKNGGNTWKPDVKSSEYVPVCPNITVDLMFVLDGSGSIGSENFDTVKTWVTDVTEQLNIDQGLVQVGVLQYSSKNSIRTEIELGAKKTFIEFKKAVDGINFMQSSTYTGEALRTVQENFIGSSRYKMKNTRQLMILLTDGKSSDPVKPNADKLRELGIETFAVGVARAVDKELLEIAGDPKRKFKLEGFNNLAGIIGNLKSEILVSLEGGKSKNESSKFELGQTGFSSVYSNTPISKVWISCCEADVLQPKDRISSFMRYKILIGIWLRITKM